MFFGIISCYSKHTHTRGFRAQTACRPPSLIPSQGATEVRKCDLNSSSKAAHPCCRRTTALFFLPLFLCLGSEYFWTFAPPGGAFGPLCFCPTRCVACVTVTCDRKWHAGKRSPVHTGNTSVGVCCLASAVARRQVVTRHSCTVFH